MVYCLKCRTWAKVTALLAVSFLIFVAFLAILASHENQQLASAGSMGSRLRRLQILPFPRSTPSFTELGSRFDLLSASVTGLFAPSTTVNQLQTYTPAGGTYKKNSTTTATSMFQFPFERTDNATGNATSASFTLIASSLPNGNFNKALTGASASAPTFSGQSNSPQEGGGRYYLTSNRPRPQQRQAAFMGQNSAAPSAVSRAGQQYYSSQPMSQSETAGTGGRGTLVGASGIARQEGAFLEGQQQLPPLDDLFGGGNVFGEAMISCDAYVFVLGAFNTSSTNLAISVNGLPISCTGKTFGVLPCTTLNVPQLCATIKNTGTDALSVTVTANGLSDPSFLLCTPPDPFGLFTAGSGNYTWTMQLVRECRVSTI